MPARPQPGPPLGPPRRRAILGAGLTLAALPFARLRAEPTPPPVVVELFTSQGCSSCPPADALLRRLAGRPDIVALGLHVDYWNRLGWVDPFASAWATARQRAYVAALGLRSPYTPQMVLDGRIDAVGSRPAAVTAALDEARATAADAVPVSLAAAAGGGLTVTVGAGAGPARILLAAYRPLAETDVAAGENGGHRLANANIVSRLADIGGWTGAPLTLAVPVAGPGGHAVLVQRVDAAGRPGRIVGAAKLDAA